MENVYLMSEVECNFFAEPLLCTDGSASTQQLASPLLTLFYFFCYIFTWKEKFCTGWYYVSKVIECLQDLLYLAR